MVGRTPGHITAIRPMKYGVIADRRLGVGCDQLIVLEPSGCADLDSDNANCGMCGLACDAPTSCVGGECRTGTSATDDCHHGTHVARVAGLGYVGLLARGEAARRLGLLQGVEVEG